MASASALGAEGPGFKSLLPDILKMEVRVSATAAAVARPRHEPKVHDGQIPASRLFKWSVVCVQWSVQFLVAY